MRAGEAGRGAAWKVQGRQHVRKSMDVALCVYGSQCGVVFHIVFD